MGAVTASAVSPQVPPRGQYGDLTLITFASLGDACESSAAWAGPRRGATPHRLSTRDFLTVGCAFQSDAPQSQVDGKA